MTTTTTDRPGGFRGRLGGVGDVLGAVGGVLLPLGLGLVLLGWYGASHTPYLFEQLPYLISGGLLGLGLVVVAGLLYVASWVSRSAAAQRAVNAELLEALRDIRDELALRAPQADRAPRRPTVANGAAPPLVATRAGSMLHRPDCTVVAGRTDLRPVQASAPGLSPCALCDPLTAGQAAGHR